MRRKIVGLDLNGRADFAARDEALEDPDQILASPVSIAGGIAVDLVVTSEGRIIAGPQADIAPHGRGQGWGPVGSSTKRRALAPSLDDPTLPHSQIDIEASIAALARAADEVVMAVPDLPSFDEVRQGALLRAGNGRRRRARLLWRPVAAFLDLLADGLISKDQVGARFRLLIHGANGFEEQVLTLVEDPDHPAHRAPRRDGPGSLILPDLGLDRLFDTSRALVRAGNPTAGWERCEPSRLGPQLICGLSVPGEVEVLRSWNGTWNAVVAPSLDIDRLLPDQAIHPSGTSEHLPTFMVTPASNELARAIAMRLDPIYGPVTLAHSACIAKGAQRAGRLIERGLPHYYDCLERIAIAVMEGDEPVFADLISEGRSVPANKEYASPVLSGFTWPARKDELQVYILKGEAEVRHWEMRKDRPPGRPVPVGLRVRQTPGQSWARLTVTSSEWEELSRAPIELDWETFQPLAKTPDEVLAELRSPPPTIPERLVEKPHIDLWMGSLWAGNGRPAQLAREAAEGGVVQIGEWAKLLSQARRNPLETNAQRYRLVGSDGELPSGLPEDVEAGFRAALQGVAAKLASRRTQPNNDALKAATWCFVMCPEQVQDRIVDAMEALATGKTHPLLLPNHAAKVVRQGAGRSVSGVDKLRRVLTAYSQGPLNNDSIAGLAMLMSRRNEAPEALERAMVDHFAHELGVQLLAQVRLRSFKVKFGNTLSALAGLFRWRVREPFALLADREPQASALRQTLMDAVRHLENMSDTQVRQRLDKIKRVESIIEYLDGRGDPDILGRLALDEEDEIEE